MRKIVFDALKEFTKIRPCVRNAYSFEFEESGIDELRYLLMKNKNTCKDEIDQVIYKIRNKQCLFLLDDIHSFISSRNERKGIWDRHFDSRVKMKTVEDLEMVDKVNDDLIKRFFKIPYNCETELPGRTYENNPESNKKLWDEIKDYAESGKPIWSQTISDLMFLDEFKLKIKGHIADKTIEEADKNEAEIERVMNRAKIRCFVCIKKHTQTDRRTIKRGWAVVSPISGLHPNAEFFKEIPEELFGKVLYLVKKETGNYKKNDIVAKEAVDGPYIITASYTFHKSELKKIKFI